MSTLYFITCVLLWLANMPSLVIISLEKKVLSFIRKHLSNSILLGCWQFNTFLERRMPAIISALASVALKEICRQYRTLHMELLAIWRPCFSNGMSASGHYNRTSVQIRSSDFPFCILTPGKRPNILKPGAI